MNASKCIRAQEMSATQCTLEGPYVRNLVATDTRNIKLSIIYWNPFMTGTEQGKLTELTN